MAEHKEDVVETFLFSSDTELVDFKCFRGDKDDISEEELRQQIHSAFMQKKMGRAKITTTAPKPKAVPVNVKDFVASL